MTEQQQHKLEVACKFCGKVHVLTGVLAKGVKPGGVEVTCGLCACKAAGVKPTVFCGEDE